MPIAWVQAAAEALAADLSGGRVPRPKRRSARRALASAYDALQAGAATLTVVRALEAPTRRLPDGPPEPLLNTMLAERRRPLARVDDDWRVGAWLKTGMHAELHARFDAHEVLFLSIARRLDRVFELFRTTPPPLASEPRESRLARETEADVKTLTRG